MKSVIGMYAQTTMANDNCEQRRCLRLVSYNLYGLNNGRSYLLDLCNDPTIDVIAMQELWLTPSHLDVLNDIHPDFAGFGISAMQNKLKSGIYTGRPFGGVGFLWRRALAKNVSILDSSDDGRCLVITLSLDDNSIIKIVNVYFPCFSADVEYSVELGNCIGFLEEVVDQSDKSIIVGDVNFPCSVDNRGFVQLQSLLSRLNIEHCDALVSNVDPVTYVSNHLNCSSFIDHCFVSHSIRPFLTHIDIVDSGANLSDHKPFIANFVFPNVASSSESRPSVNAVRSPARYIWRWDKTDTSSYAQMTEVNFHNLLNCYGFNVLDLCDEDCNCVQHQVLIDRYYNTIVSILLTAANQAVVRLPCNSLKPYWNDELNSLKQSAITWHDIWVSAGRPGSGQLHNIKCSTKMKYKIAIRDAYINFENSVDDCIYRHFLNKRPTEFWKSWNAKFRRSVNKNVVIDGCQDDLDIANKFASYFSNVYQQCDVNMPNNSTSPVHARTIDGAAQCVPHPDCNVGQLITPDLVGRCITNITPGKACGPDNLSIEHAIHSHSNINQVLCNLFKWITCHRYVPTGFCMGTIVPLVKDKTRNLNDIENYRPITLIPVISKIFEHVILQLCENSLTSDQLQFGFKKGIGCVDTIFALRITVEYFLSKGSSMYLAALDIRKAFDSVKHDKLFDCLLKQGVPLILVDVLRNWYSKLFVNVRWGGSQSSFFDVCNGVRQGSVLSPCLFNIFVNSFIVLLRQLDVGCHVNWMYVGCLLYADDMLLLSPSVMGLQKMLDLCLSTSNLLALKFNANKSFCMAIGKHSKFAISPMLLGDDNVAWVHSIKYLGIKVTGGKSLMFDSDSIKQSFFAASNCIYAHAKHLDEIVHLSLQECYSLPILSYVVAALKYNSKQYQELNACWNSVYRIIFGFHKYESVKTFICGLGRLDFHHLTRVSRAKFYMRLFTSDHALLKSLFWTHVTLNCDSDNELYLVCVLRCKANILNNINDHFYRICN